MIIHEIRITNKPNPSLALDYIANDRHDYKLNIA